MRMHPIVRALLPVVKGLAEALGPDCEVVLHDASGVRRSIVAIENGHITGRSLGFEISEEGLRDILSEAGEDRNFVANFPARAPDGRRLRANTLFLRDEEGRIVGYLCLNFDTTRAEILKEMADFLVGGASDECASRIPPTGDAESANERNLRAMRHFLGGSLRIASREEKLRAVSILDGEGFFLLKGAVETFAREARLSVYTVYRYLRQIRGGKGQGDAHGARESGAEAPAR